MDPTLTSILNKHTLQWIFVGGKGGVGKTTTSCALATLLARTPCNNTSGAEKFRKVLLVSTDPAHNVSDAFSQSFTSQPTPVQGVENLDAMEINPSAILKETSSSSSSTSGDAAADSPSSTFQTLTNIIRQAASSLPGIDEVTVLVEIMRQVEALQYDIVVFDTAPTGHTLRLLALPQTLNESLDRIFEVQGIKNLISMASAMFGRSVNSEDIMQTVQKWRENVKSIQGQFNDHSKTTFVCVCIPEFLSVYETERLVQELSKYNIACEHVVVNQLVKKPLSEQNCCKMCDSRIRIQSKYMKQIYDLYEDFHVVEMPLMSDEVRGSPALIKFSEFLSSPYDVEKHGYL